MHKRSDAEQAIRDRSVEALRAALPGARIIHELNTAGTGSKRVDLAAVTPSQIVMVENKSERDTLKRASSQIKAFGRVSHFLIIASHAKFAKMRPPYPNADHSQIMPPVEFKGADAVWWFPDFPPGLAPFRSPNQWAVPFDRRLGPRIPNPYTLLHLLWRAEMYHAAVLHGMPVKKNFTMRALARAMCEGMTGREITTSVCRALRARKFAEADAPIIDPLPAPEMRPQDRDFDI